MSVRMLQNVFCDKQNDLEKILEEEVSGQKFQPSSILAAGNLQILSVMDKVKSDENDESKPLAISRNQMQLTRYCVSQSVPVALICETVTVSS